MENENRLVKAKEVEEIFNYEVSVTEKDPLDAFDSAILNAATVDAREVVHGRWLIKGRGIRACSCCDHGIREHMACFNHFCPNCGADMRDGDFNESATGN